MTDSPTTIVVYPYREPIVVIHSPCPGQIRRAALQLSSWRIPVVAGWYDSIAEALRCVNDRVHSGHGVFPDVAVSAVTDEDRFRSRRIGVSVDGVTNGVSAWVWLGTWAWLAQGKGYKR